jgi:hypothetical protein
MSSSSSVAFDEFVARVRAPGYLIFFIVLIIPLVDYGAVMLPVHLSNATWRFGAVGLSGGYAVATIAELYLFFALAVAAKDRKVVIAVGVVSALIAVVLLAGSAGFVLDTLQTRRLVAPVNVQRFDMGAVESLLKLMLGVLTGAVLAVSAFRAARRSRQSMERTGAAAPLVVGRAGQIRAASASEAGV